MSSFSDKALTRGSNMGMVWLGFWSWHGWDLGPGRETRDPNHHQMFRTPSTPLIFNPQPASDHIFNQPPASSLSLFVKMEFLYSADTRLSLEPDRSPIGTCSPQTHSFTHASTSAQLRFFTSSAVAITPVQTHTDFTDAIHTPKRTFLTSCHQVRGSTTLSRTACQCTAR